MEWYGLLEDLSPRPSSVYACALGIAHSDWWNGRRGVLASLAVVVSAAAQPGMGALVGAARVEWDSGHTGESDRSKARDLHGFGSLKPGARRPSSGEARSRSESESDSIVVNVSQCAWPRSSAY